MKPLILATVTVCIILGVASSAFGAKGCIWSGCEDKMIAGELICKLNGLGTFNGQVSFAGCGRFTTKVKCCPLKSECKFTSKCYGPSYGAKLACRSDFGEGYVPSPGGESYACSSGWTWNTKQFKCCN